MTTYRKWTTQEEAALIDMTIQGQALTLFERTCHAQRVRTFEPEMPSNPGLVKSIRSD